MVLLGLLTVAMWKGSGVCECGEYTAVCLCEYVCVCVCVCVCIRVLWPFVLSTCLAWFLIRTVRGPLEFSHCGIVES